MDEVPFKALMKRLFSYLLSYIKAYGDYLRYEAADRVVTGLTYVVSNVLAVVLLAICLNITFLALVFAIGIAYKALPIALLVIAGVYLLAGLVLVVFRRALISRPLQKQLVELLFNDSRS